mmetsp:Transcript_49326/g.57659  ORF Transcript_49326/g.57659 Transcript_49326/m.57659 type:complete len:247 (-) Transcript_49326:4642-5382(-)
MLVFEHASSLLPLLFLLVLLLLLPPPPTANHSERSIAADFNRDTEECCANLDDMLNDIGFPLVLVVLLSNENRLSVVAVTTFIRFALNLWLLLMWFRDEDDDDDDPVTPRLFGRPSLLSLLLLLFLHPLTIPIKSVFVGVSLLFVPLLLSIFLGDLLLGVGSEGCFLLAELFLPTLFLGDLLGVGSGGCFLLAELLLPLPSSSDGEKFGKMVDVSATDDIRDISRLLRSVIMSMAAIPADGDLLFL